METGRHHKPAPPRRQVSPSNSSLALAKDCRWVAVAGATPGLKSGFVFPRLAPMSLEELRRSLAADPAPPAGATLALQALWHAARGDWNAAHGCAQEDHSRDGSWVHAHLHRQEGDLGNAGYWYARAGRRMPPASSTLEAEWEEIARALLPAKA
jgi:hypothetical protein